MGRSSCSGTTSRSRPALNGGNTERGRAIRFRGERGPQLLAATAPPRISNDPVGRNGTTYHYQIRAMATGNVEGAASDEKSATPYAPPNTPRGLEADPGDRQVTLTWTDPGNAGINRYDYQYREDGGNYGNWLTVTGSDASTTSHTVTGLENRKTYFFQIRAATVGGESRVAGPVSAIPNVVPPQPTIVKIVPGNGKLTVTVRATSYEHIVSWQRRYKASGDANFGRWAALTVTGSGNVDRQGEISGLTNDTAYSVEVRAINATFEGPPSDAKEATPHAKPGALAGFTVTPKAGKVTLSWTNPNNANIIRYQYEQDGDGNWKDLTLTSAEGATTMEADVSGLANGTQYSFKIRAVTSVHDGDETRPSTAIPNVVPPKPTIVEIVPGNGKLAVTVRATSYEHIVSWQQRYKTSSDANYGSWAALTVTGSGNVDRQGEISGLANDTTYSVEVRAINATFEGPESDEMEATPHAAPGAPTNLAAAPGNTEVTLTWTAPVSDHITGYEYQQKVGSGTYGDWLPISGSTASTTDHDVTGLTNGTEYTFKVRAVTSGHKGAASSEASMKPNAPASKPQGFRLEPGNETVKLLWNDQSSETSVEWWQYREGTGDPVSWGAWTTITGSNSATTDFERSGRRNGTTYHYQIRAMATGNVEGIASDEKSATPHAPPGKPTGLTADAGDRQVTLKWTDPGNAAIIRYDYRHKVEGGTYGAWAPMTGIGASMTSDAMTGLENRKTYTFQIRAATVGGPSSESDPASATPNVAPAQPSGFKLEPGDEEIKLVWNDQSGDVSDIVEWEYQEKIGDAAWSGWLTLPGSTKNTTFHTFDRLANDTVYGYRIRSKGIGNMYSASSPDQFATPKGPPLPRR